LIDHRGIFRPSPNVREVRPGPVVQKAYRFVLQLICVVLISTAQNSGQFIPHLQCIPNYFLIVIIEIHMLYNRNEKARSFLELKFKHLFQKYAKTDTHSQRCLYGFVEMTFALPCFCDNRLPRLPPSPSAFHILSTYS
jgi:hypothetical protein